MPIARRNFACLLTFTVALACVGGCSPSQTTGGVYGFADGTGTTDTFLPPVDAKTDTGKIDVKSGDTAKDALELCKNFVDDNDDGRIDEGCYSAPNLRSGRRWTDLGVIEVGDTPETTPSRSYGVAVKNDAVLLVARDVGDSPYSHYVWADRLVSPNGPLVLTPGEWATSLNRAYPGIGASTALVGMSELVIVSTGPWSFRFIATDQQPMKFAGSTSPTWLHLGVLGRTALPSQQPATLDLDVYLAGGVPLPAAQMVKSHMWDKMLKRIEQIWKPAGIVLGDVHVYDLGGEDGKKFKYLDNVLAGDASNELNHVYAAAGKLHPQSTAVMVIITAGLHDNGMPVAAGLSQLAGVPGLPSSRMGGIALAIDPDQWQQVEALGPSANTAADVWGVVLAHEIGHFLGLWHTDEYDGKLHDPIGDTPVCTTDAEKLTAEVCKAQSKFLMFWSPQGSTVTPQQALVVRRSPALRSAE